MSSSSDFTGDQELQDVDQSVCLSNLIDSISELQLLLTQEEDGFLSLVMSEEGKNSSSKTQPVKQ